MNEDFNGGLAIYSIDKEREEMIIHLGNLNKIHRKYMELKQENQRLKNSLNQANENKEEQKRRKELIQRKRDYYKSKYHKIQKRNNEAIEYVKYWWDRRENQKMDNQIQHLLKILEGSER